MKSSPPPVFPWYTLPSDNDSLHSPRRPSDIFDSMPATCIQSLAVLRIPLLRAASRARNADAVHSEFLLFQIPPNVVGFPSCGGNPGASIQSQGYRYRVRCATAGDWDKPPREAIQSHRIRHERAAHPPFASSPWPNDHRHDPRSRRAERLAVDHNMVVRSIHCSSLESQIFRTCTLLTACAPCTQHPAPPSLMMATAATDLPLLLNMTMDAVL
eukprot:GFKZ01011016.1.p1 GENE.GFKZ01011016.1~~GFKZ01011016.1.p1  ORF type:complete len:214 (-),score=1.68 GFKZ01011016.1:1940-2581(-)